jgi:hypothetical protein
MRLTPKKKQPVLEPVSEPEPEPEFFAWLPFVAELDGSRHLIERDVKYAADHPCVLAYPERFTRTGVPPIQWAFH